MKKENDVEVIVLNVNNFNKKFNILNDKIDELLNAKTVEYAPQSDTIFMKDVCKLTNSKRATIYNLVFKKAIPFLKPAGTKKLMFSRKAIEKWLLDREF